MRHLRLKKSMLLGLAAVLLLGGCGTRGISSPSAATTEYQFLEEGSASELPSGNQYSGVTNSDAIGENKILFGNQVGMEDNTSDAYHAVINYPVKKVEAEGEKQVVGRIFVGEGGCVRHGNHMYSSYKMDWDGISGITKDAYEFELHLRVDADREANQIDNIGPIAGKEGYVACFYDYPDGKLDGCWLYELDKTFSVVRKAYAKLNCREQFRDLTGDGKGNFHVIYDGMDGKQKYAIISPEGETILEEDAAGSARLYAFEQGRVALRVMELSGMNERRLYEADPECGVLEEMSVSEDEDARQKIAMESNILEIAPLDEKRLLLCTEEGLSIYDMKKEELERIYQWSNHGILPLDVEYLTMMTDGSIAMLYKENMDPGFRYLLLQPTTEKKEQKSITMAVSANNKAAYLSAATYFQRLYPNYVINIKDDYDQMSLLTQLGAGNGPVLVDTSLTGFEELEKLWQPLDGFLEQTALKRELLPEALNFGKIGDVTYGIVRDFRMETLLVPSSGPKDWNYEGFVNALEGFQGAAFTSRGIETVADLRKTYFEIMMNGLQDNYYFDSKTDRMIFDTQDFERLVKQADKALRCPNSESGKSLKDGRALCECMNILVIEDVFRLRRRMEANGERAIGYPTCDGGRAYLIAGAPLAVRSTATEEEKKIAYTFLKVYLSKEAMLEGGYLFPVRKDVLEEAIELYKNSVASMKEAGTYNPDFMPELDEEKDIAFLMELIHGGILKKDLPTGLQQVFDEELDAYLEGGISTKMLADHLRSRVGLYLQEMK